MIVESNKRHRETLLQSAQPSSADWHNGAASYVSRRQDGAFGLRGTAPDLGRRTPMLCMKFAQTKEQTTFFKPNLFSSYARCVRLLRPWRTHAAACVYIKYPSHGGFHVFVMHLFLWGVPNWIYMLCIVLSEKFVGIWIFEVLPHNCCTELKFYP